MYNMRMTVEFKQLDTLCLSTYSMLCKNSPFGRLNFLMLSADAEAKQCLQQKKDYIYI